MRITELVCYGFRDALIDQALRPFPRVAASVVRSLPVVDKQSLPNPPARSWMVPTVGYQIQAQRLPRVIHPHAGRLAPTPYGGGEREIPCDRESLRWPMLDVRLTNWLWWRSHIWVNQTTRRRRCLERNGEDSPAHVQALGNSPGAGVDDSRSPDGACPLQQTFRRT